MDLNYGDVDKRMKFYPANTETTVGAHELLRALARAHAKAVMDLLPPGREKSLVLTSLEEALMWANAAVARNGGPATQVTVTTLNEIRADFGINYGTGSEVA